MVIICGLLASGTHSRDWGITGRQFCPPPHLSCRSTNKYVAHVDDRLPYIIIRFLIIIKKLASTRVYAYIYIYTLLYIVIHDGSSTYVTRVRARWNVSPSRALSFSLCLCLFLSLYLSISSIIKSLIRRNFVELRLPCVWCAKMISKTSTFLRQSMVTRGMTLRAFAGSQTHRDSNVASDLRSGSLRMMDLRVDDDRNWSILLRCVTTTITTTMIATTARIVVAIWTLSRLPEKCRRACFGVRCHGGDDSRCTDYYTLNEVLPSH